MKNVNLLKAIPVVASLAAMFCAAPVFAQGHAMRFDIPFQFVAGDRMFPAGQYLVSLDVFSSLVLQPAKENKLYVLKVSTDLAQRSHKKDVSEALLRFTQHGDTLFLTAAWAPDHYDGKTLAPSARLLEADRTAETGSAGAAPADVYVK